MNATRGSPQESRILCIPDIEALHDLSYRAGEVGQQVSRYCLIVARQAGNDDVGDIGYGHSAGSQIHARYEPRIVPSK